MRIIYSSFNIKGCYGKTIFELLEEYREEKMNFKDKCVIDLIRRRLLVNPRVIALSVDNKEYCIYDGWHTAIAFVL